eukprot:scaffold9627_cov220-Skeletonema_dohrnii-CCMP3373.AAC.1
MGCTASKPTAGAVCVASSKPVGADETKEDDNGEAKIDEAKIDPSCTPISKSARALSNYKVQVVLILAGLRGA